MTGDYFIYLNKSFWLKNNNERSLELDRLIPMSHIKRIWDNGDGFFGIAQDTYNDLFVEKTNPNETILEFYKRSYVPIPSQIAIDPST